MRTLKTAAFVGETRKLQMSGFMESVV